MLKSEAALICKKANGIPLLTLRRVKLSAFSLLIRNQMDWCQANTGGVAAADIAPDCPRPDTRSISTSTHQYDLSEERRRDSYEQLCTVCRIPGQGRII